MEVNAIKFAEKTILIVDDNRVFVRDLVQIFSRNGYRVMTATNGADAVTILEHKSMDLILLNVELSPDAENVCGPFRDGFVILDWVHKMHHAEKTPVIMMSATDPEKYKDRARAAGIRTMFKKPVNKEMLLEAVRATLADPPSVKAA